MKNNRKNTNPDSSGKILPKVGKRKILFTLIFAVVMQVSFAQTEWAPIGAKWYYERVENPMGPPPWKVGYLTIESIKDTIVFGIPSKILQKTYFSPNGDTIDAGTEIMYSDIDKVYHFLYGNFYVLYDFSLQPMDTFKIKEPYFTGTSPDTSITLVVDSTSFEIIDGKVLKVQYHRRVMIPASAIPWYTSGKIIERIGDINYMFPNNQLDCDAGNCLYLRCYSDSILSYQISYIPCDTLIGNVNEINLNNNFYIYPNPIQDVLYIQNNSPLKSPYNLYIYNIFGKTIYYEKNIIDSNKKIKIPELKNGIYVIQINDKDYLYFKKILKI